ncbi:MAG: 30S ribosomal protein S12 methylthiotransferase RimO [Chthonomonadales bacterium]|nr:30S ribosomal protein S12 methylthiotransferase RimO [Chthonomonadales bacterium]
MPEVQAQPGVQVITLGCPKNEVDSEEMLGVLDGEGYALRAADEPTDVVVVNTCGFIESAKRESVDAILEAVERKKAGSVSRVIVAGCLAQRYRDELAAEMPEVDAFVGTGQMAAIGRAAAPSVDGAGRIALVPERPRHRWVDAPSRPLSAAPWMAYLKISEGCDHRCTFCAIPSFRGPHVSKPLERVVAEARYLVARGARELNLIAQDSTQYGHDLYGRSALPELLRALSDVDGARWLRVFYCYPSRVTPEVIAAIAETPRVCQYIDMPLQHADSDILRAMRRPMSARGYLDLVRRLRDASPDVAIRTTFIVGFPGETEEQFASLLRFAEEARFDRAGAFEFSAEDGTPASALPGRVPLRVKRERMGRLMRLQQGISLERNRAWVGRELEVLVERPAPPQDARDGGAAHGGRSAAVPASMAGRSFRDAPEIDGEVRVGGAEGARPGDFVRVRVTRAHTYDLEGVATPASMEERA